MSEKVALKTDGTVKLSSKFRKRLRYRYEKIMRKHDVPTHRGTSVEAMALICLIEELNSQKQRKKGRRLCKR